jgi:hypothetical protein
MSFGEAYRVAMWLARDPSSAVGASMAGWDYPFSHEALILADLFDLHHTLNSKQRPKPHPLRPFRDQTTTRRLGNTGGRSRAQVLALLDAARAGRTG